MSITACRQIGRVSDEKWHAMKLAAERAEQSFTEWATDALMAAVSRQNGDVATTVARNGKLVLTRKPGELLIFRVRQPDGTMLNAVLGVSIEGPNRVRVEFEGPAQIELWREEVKIKERRDES